VSDQSALGALKDGTPEALERFLREHAPQVLAWAIRLGPPELPPEAVAWTALHQVAQRVKLITDEAQLLRALFQATRRAIEALEPPEVRAQPDEAQGPRQRHAVQRALQGLAPVEREALILLDIEARPLVVASFVSGRSAGELAGALSGARDRFREALMAQGLVDRPRPVAPPDPVPKATYPPMPRRGR
jgi:hypothetical protein